MAHYETNKRRAAAIWRRFRRNAAIWRRFSGDEGFSKYILVENEYTLHFRRARSPVPQSGDFSKPAKKFFEILLLAKNEYLSRFSHTAHPLPL
jgi:hypothetical protein